VGVWVGNFDRTPLKGATGVTGAGPIFQSVMLAAHDRLTPGYGAESGAGAAQSPGVALLGKTPKGMRRADFCSSPSCTTMRQDWTTGKATAKTVGALRMQLVEPSADATYVIDQTRPLDSQQLPLVASGASGNVSFTVDGSMSGPLWPLAAGQHRACAVDSAVPAQPVCHTFSVEGP
jgi:membrane carboxypeptidase/penicillin-binding protein PbpC